MQNPNMMQPMQGYAQVNGAGAFACPACKSTAPLKIAPELTVCGKVCCFAGGIIGLLITLCTCKAEKGRCSSCNAIVFDKQKGGCLDCC